MATWQTHAVCTYLRATRKNPVAVRRRRADPLAAGRPPSPPPRRLGDRLEVEAVGGFDVVRVRPRPGNPTTPGALAYLHGGAFRSGIAKQHWRLIAELSDATGRDVYVPRYGLIPDHTAGDARAFLDVVCERLRPLAPLHLLGDSAGGNLALLVAQAHAADRTPDGGAVVAGVTLIAPWLDLSIGNPRVPAVAARDPWLDPVALRPVGAYWAANRDPRDPTVSPLFGPLDDLPPTAVFVGTRDVCLPDCELLAARAPAVDLQVTEGSPHVHPLLPTPEGRAARGAILRHVEDTFAGVSPAGR